MKVYFYRGKIQTLKEITDALDLNLNIVQRRLNRGLPLEEALNPVVKKRTTQSEVKYYAINDKEKLTLREIADRYKIPYKKLYVRVKYFNFKVTEENILNFDKNTKRLETIVWEGVEYSMYSLLKTFPKLKKYWVYKLIKEENGKQKLLKYLQKMLDSP